MSRIAPKKRQIISFRPGRRLVPRIRRELALPQGPAQRQEPERLRQGPAAAGARSGGRGNRRRRAIRLDAGFAQHVSHRILDIGLGQRGIAALGRHAADTVDGIFYQGIQALGEPRLPLILGANLGSACCTRRMAGHADLVVNLLARQLQFGASGLRHGHSDPGDRFDAFDRGRLLARAIVGSNAADDAYQGAYHEQHRGQQRQP